MATPPKAFAWWGTSVGSVVERRACPSVAPCIEYRGTLLIRTTFLLGPYRKPMPGVLGGVLGGVGVFV